MVLSTALFDKPAFKNVICNGLILAEDGKKFSKRLDNFVPPADFVINMVPMQSECILLVHLLHMENHLNLMKNIFQEINSKYIQWFNCNKFFIEHLTKYQKDGNIFNINAYKKSTNVIDNWILSRLGSMINQINLLMNEYTFYKVKPEIMDFIEDLTNWYIKFNRNRLRGRYCDSNEQGQALSTLYQSLSYCSVKLQLHLCHFYRRHFIKL